jgi:xanthine/uracil permease
MIQRISVFTGWLVLAFVVYATLSPVGARPVLALPHLEHFAAFALMGLAFALAYPNRVLLVVALVAGTAAGLEALQLLTPDRHGRAADAFVKALGGISGIQCWPDIVIPFADQPGAIRWFNPILTAAILSSP